MIIVIIIIILAINHFTLCLLNPPQADGSHIWTETKILGTSSIDVAHIDLQDIARICIWQLEQQFGKILWTGRTSFSTPSHPLPPPCTHLPTSASASWNVSAIKVFFSQEFENHWDGSGEASRRRRLGASGSTSPPPRSRSARTSRSPKNAFFGWFSNTFTTLRWVSNVIFRAISGDF